MSIPHAEICDADGFLSYWRLMDRHTYLYRYDRKQFFAERNEIRELLDALNTLDKFGLRMKSTHTDTQAT